MPGRGVFRPRVLAAIFGGFVLVIAIISWWFSTGPGSGYVYGPDLTRWVYATYLIVAAVLLSGIGVVAVGSMRHLDHLIDEAEMEAMKGNPGDGVELTEHEESEALPPPLREAPAGKDQVDQDIDELLVSLQEIETSAERAEEELVEEFVEEVAEEPAAERRVFASAGKKASWTLEKWKRRRAEVPSFFAGPALISIGIIGVAAAMLPGADAMLQTYNQLNTALILGMGYTYGGIALYAALSVYAILRHK